MAYTISQAGGAGTGGDDESLEDCRIGLPISINLPVSDGATYLHVLLDKASDESATLSNTTSATATISAPTVTGTFRVRSTVTTAAGVETTYTRVVRVTKDADGNIAAGGICPTAFGELPGESNANGNERGYVQRHEENFRALIAYPETEHTVNAGLVPDQWNTISGGDTYTLPDPADWRGRSLLAYNTTASPIDITCTGTIVGGADAHTYTLPATSAGGAAVVFRSAADGAARWLASGRV